MTQHQLPAYLQNRQVQDFTDYAGDGIGGALPPHVSIQGNMFTLIDAAGQEFQPMATMDCVIVDRSTVTCKMYFGKPWTPGSEEPPMCWSTNGIGPSRDAVAPQARTCAECDKNVRGSAQSAISGAAIKACRDEFHLAILLPSMPDILFRYVLTPGSFKNWQAYVGKFKNSNVKMSMVVTRMSFVPKVNGEVQFESISYVDEATNARVEKALLEKATDVLCGRLDTPRTAAISGPAVQSITVTNPGPGQLPIAPVAQVQQPAPLASSAPNAAGQPTAAAPALATAPHGAPAASPSEGAQAPRRRRRTAAEMAAVNGAAPVQAAPTTAPQAPFPVQGGPQQAVGGPPPGTPVPPNNFGVGGGQPVAANPELAGMLDNFFKG